jgi:hypothetical protein
MGLAIIMIVLIGVMGAGLLTFVRSDLNSVIEENGGQRALDIADAGVQDAKAHLRVDSFREHYDTDSGNDCNEGIRVGGDNWSKATDIYTDPNGYCVGPGTRADDLNTPWREDQGVSKLFGGGRFHVTIECYDQNDTVCDIGGAGSAPPEDIPPPADEKFFKITSTGYDTEAGDGAVRKIEAIYTTSKKTYAPIAFWSPRDINFSGTDCVKKMSFFAGRNITGATSGNGCGPPNPFGTQKLIAHRPPTTTPPLPPDDAIYGHWQNAYNPTMRVDASGTPITKVGFGAVGRVCSGACPDLTSTTSMAGSIADGFNDYDRTTGPLPGRNVGQKKKFVSPLTNPSSEITFPFDPGVGLANPSSLVEEGLLEEMRAAAEAQGNCHAATPTPGVCSNTAVSTINAWPAPGAIYFADGTNITLSLSESPDPSGMLIVRGGDVNWVNSSADFEGVIIVIGNGNLAANGSCATNSGTGYYTQPGQVNLDGYVAASGCIQISGNVEPSTTIDYTNLNSFYDVKLWSWRELYE